MSTLQASKEQINILPGFLRPYFWEVDFSAICLPDHERYVLERVLEYGNDQAIRWLMKRFDAQAIGRVVRESRRLSRNTANLWALVLNIPKEEIKCFSTPSLIKLGSF